MQSYSLSEPMAQVTPAQVNRDEQLMCKLEKMRKNGKLVFYTYACRILDHLHILTTFTGCANNDAVSYQLVLHDEQLRLTPLTITLHDRVQEYGTDNALVTINLNFYDDAEEQSSELFHRSLTALRDGGVLIAEIGSMFARPLQNMIWVLRQSFVHVRVVKPVTVAPYTDTKYLVCTGKRVNLPREPPLAWYSFLTGLENEYTYQKNKHQRAACELTEYLVTQSTGLQVEVAEAYLVRILEACLQDNNLRQFATQFCRNNKIDIL